ncbi:hypothetical protein HPB49_012141 [Dermacentor silvarum]|uniref:Uncharacterized protein n=1 Tax=Dermacentor silvarum TaxID=543639 RepID=A0ACB8C3G8_DERSI|nr:hypothetical protein HPB49_012141 [Dermacentor silvarum]
MAQCRRGRRKLNPTSGQPPPSSPLEPQPILTMRKPAPRPAPLPLDDYKLVMRPRSGLDVAKLAPSELSLALLQDTNTTWREANLRLRIDHNQNTATVSTPTKDMAMKLIEVSKIKVGETEHSVEMCGLAPDDAVKGVIHGVPTRLTIQEIKENIMEDGFEIYTVRRMGKDSTTVILTFAGPDVPHYLWLYGAEYRCTLHKKTVPVCWVCYEVGHRSTACPRPGTRACHECGTRDPAPGHTSVAKCTLCGGGHVTGTKGCPERFITPYLIRQRERQKQHEQQALSTHLSRRDQTLSSGEGRSATPGGGVRSTSRSTTRDQSSTRKKRSRSRGRTTTPARNNADKQVGWAGRPSIVDKSQFPKLGQADRKSQCDECEQLKKMIERQSAQIDHQNKQIAKLTEQLHKQDEMTKSLLAKIEAAETNRQEETNVKRKLAKRDTQPDMESLQEAEGEPRWARPLQEVSNAVAQLTCQMAQLAAQVEQVCSEITKTSAKGSKLEANVNEHMLAKKSRKNAPCTIPGTEVHRSGSSLDLTKDGAAN